MSGSVRSLPRKRIPSYLRHKASGQAYVRIEGQFHYLGPYGSDVSRQRYGELISEFAAGRLIDPLAAGEAGKSVLTVAQLVLAYLRHAETYYVKNGQPTDEVGCIKSAMKPLVALYGALPADNFGPLALKAVRQHMVSSGKKCRRTINHAVGRIRRCFRYGVENELVEPTVLTKLQAVPPLLAGRTEAKDHVQRHVVPQQHIDAVKAIVPERTKDMIELALLTGARPGELVMLTGDMIDRSGDVWSARLTGHKTEHHGRSRYLDFGPKAQLILRRYLPEDPSRRLFPILRATFSNAIKLACRELKIPVFTGHWLRHNAGSRVREEHGLDAAQTVLGHANASMSELYAHLDRDKAIKIARDAG